MASDATGLAVFALLGLMFPVTGIMASKLFRPHRPSVRKEAIYECGETPLGETPLQFHFQYYIYALIFVVFDILAVFLFLWAYVYRSAPAETLLPVGALVGIMLVALAYALKKESYTWI